MSFQPKTVLVARGGVPDGVLINADDFDEHTDVLFTATAKSTAKLDAAKAALTTAQEIVAKLVANGAADIEIENAKQILADAATKVSNLTPAA